MKASPLLALPSLAAASTITLTATLCSSTADQDLNPFTIDLPLNQLTALISNPDAEICNLSITATSSSSLDLDSISCTLYAPADLTTALPSTLTLASPITNTPLGSALCTAQTPTIPLSRRLLQLLHLHAAAPSVPLTARDSIHISDPIVAFVGKRETKTYEEKRAEATAKDTNGKNEHKRAQVTGINEHKREAKPTKGEPSTPTVESGSKPTNQGTEKKEGAGEEKREEEEQSGESGESVGKRQVKKGVFVGAAPGIAKVEMGIFGVGALAIGIAALVM
ncbi:hypothetical protein COCCADRAFT_4343 [Bipolaris zeicola 26-R-13]|uniref:Ubiquitin 3 binding protein But2 C-terminal domain-containing protein n=1 Tax=Cochliobolus carbonum (strain 26-R-13) TaxID=930089 RepID=W6Y8P6_COCC2|nr:uncharacterized protein COCCADRAFT_4343 [Bipolaris zeicola 26-R-13]EUC34303.1 hypothetical protein COCCADRAFT_4343 [Bipolaris zeicola 26-R-13]